MRLCSTMDEAETTSTAASPRPASLEKVLSQTNLWPAYQLILSRKSVEDLLGLSGSSQSFTVVHVDTLQRWKVTFTASGCADKRGYLLEGWRPVAEELAFKPGDVVSLERLSASTLALSHLVPPVLAPKTLNQQQTQRSCVCRKPERDSLSRFLEQMEARVTEKVLPVLVPETSNQQQKQQSCLCTIPRRDSLSLFLQQMEAQVTEKAIANLQSRSLLVTPAHFLDTPERQ